MQVKSLAHSSVINKYVFFLPLIFKVVLYRMESAIIGRV